MWLGLVVIGSCVFGAFVFLCRFGLWELGGVLVFLVFLFSVRIDAVQRNAVRSQRGSKANDDQPKAA